MYVINISWHDILLLRIIRTSTNINDPFLPKKINRENVKKRYCNFKIVYKMAENY